MRSGAGEPGRVLEGEVGKEVWTPISRWNISVGSSSLSSSSRASSKLFVCVVIGISDTMPSSRVTSFDKLLEAVSANESREAVREASIGVRRCVLVP